MNIAKIHKNAIISALVIGFTVLPTIVNASGSFNPSSGNNLYRQYGLGKQVFHKKLACDSCPFADQTFDKESARDLINQLRSREDLVKLLKPSERKATVYYLKKRHKLS